MKRVKEIIRRIKRVLDMFPGSPGIIRPGKWFVIYNDGQKSMKMTFDVCWSYANHFGGKVYHITDKVDT